MKTLCLILSLLLAAPLFAANDAPAPKPTNPSQRIPVVMPQVRAVQNPAHHSVFFECRGNELFCIEKDALEAQAAQAPAGKEIGDASYTADPTFLSMSLLRLTPKPNVHGEAAANLDRADSKFRMALQRLNPKQDLLIFITRPDSAGVHDKARQIAEAAGFSTASQPLDKDKPITLGK